MRSSHARLFIGITLGLLLLAWFLWSIHWPDLWQALQLVKPGLVLLAATVLFLEFIIRTLHWHILLRPVAPQSTFGDLFSATLIGAATNTLLPARAGDVTRPLIAMRRTGAPLAPIIATNVMERVFDLVGLLFIFVLMMLVLPESSGPEGELVMNLRRYGALFGGAGTAGLLFFAFLVWRRARARGLFAHLVGLLPARFQTRALNLFDGFMDGLTALGRKRDVAMVVSLTFLMWLNGAFAILLLFKAFSIPLPFGAACFTAVAIALTVVLPQAPGFVGVFHMAIEKTLLLWGMAAAPAQGFAIIFWGISFVPVTAAGLLAVWREGLSLGELLSQGEPPVDHPTG